MTLVKKIAVGLFLKKTDNFEWECHMTLVKKECSATLFDRKCSMTPFGKSDLKRLQARLIASDYLVGANACVSGNR